MIQKFLLKYRKQFLGAAIGAALGLSYYVFIGCSSGSCMITSNPYISTAYGALMGYLLIGTFKKDPENEKA